MSLADDLQTTHPSEVVAVVAKALAEYLDEVSELRVDDLDVAGMAHQIADRIRFGFPDPEPDPTPPHGIERPPLVVYGLTPEPHAHPHLTVIAGGSSPHGAFGRFR